MNYLLGDLQGCCDALQRLLAEIDFSPSRDRLYVLGDLVNRGPASVETLETLAGLGASATCLLGNHDLHLLAVAAGVRPPHHNDTLGPLLASTRREHWLNWLRHQHLALFEHGWLMVHAGLPPQWDAAQTLAEASRIEADLQYGGESGAYASPGSEAMFLTHDEWKQWFAKLPRVTKVDLESLRDISKYAHHTLFELELAPVEPG